MFHVRTLLAIRLIAAALFLLLASVPVSAQEAASTGNLASIEKALLRIAEVLDRQSRQTHTSLLLSRLEIENRDIRSLDGAVISNRDSLRQLELQEREFVAAIEQERDRIDRETMSQDERLEELRQLDDGEARLANMRATRADLEQRVIELENQAHDATLRRDALRAEIDELLGVDQR